MSASKFFTNSEKNSLFNKFEGIFEYQKDITQFDILVGYFRSSGYFKVRPFLEKIKKIRILIGINVDALIQSYHQKGQVYLDNPQDTKETFLSEMIQDIQDADESREMQEGIIQFIEDLLSGKIEIKASAKQKLHAKIYIFRPQIFNEHSTGAVITGSSNLTEQGLGTHKQPNYEFNVLLKDYEDVKFATDEFERLWAEGVNILPTDAKTLQQKTFLREDLTPYELYLKTLIDYFGDRVEYDPYNIEMMLPDKYKRLQYQTDAANQGYAIMMKHNGFLLADVVGLGKTIIATMIARKFIYENGTHSNILVVVPPALETAWRRTVKDFGVERFFKYETVGRLNNILDRNNGKLNAEDFDLVIIDESHKFRNDYTIRYEQLQEICKIPRIKPSQNGDKRKKVILISATPMNNRPKDIENQLYFFQDKRNSTLEGVRNIQEYFKDINKKYDEISAQLKKEKIISQENYQNILQSLKKMFYAIRQDIIEPLVIRRTRTDIENSAEYLEDLEKQGIKFPKIDNPSPIYYYLDQDLSKLFDDTISLITALDENGEQESKGLGYFRYRAIEFLKVEHQKSYGNVGQISDSLAAIMKTMLVKRLESSFSAFKISLKRLHIAMQNMLEMFAHDKIFIAPDFDINQLLADGHSEEEIENKINAKADNNKVFRAADFQENFVEYLKTDAQKIEILLEAWEKIDTDPKLECFEKHIEGTFFDKEQNLEQKLVIFTEAKDTANQLEKFFHQKGNFKILSVNSENRKDLQEKITANFDANLEEIHQKNDYQIIITTEVLAEGVNLHRSNVIVNYDVPWNATRLMQRIGRVNRIGTKADKVFVYNFYPSTQGDKEINLVANALRKLQAFHTAFGEDNKIFSELEELNTETLYGHQIKQEESEILRYLNELRDFKKKFPKRYKEIAEMPHKSRCGREAKQNISLYQKQGETPIEASLQNSTLFYLKSDNHIGIFCWVSQSLNVQELSFLEAVKILKAPENEKPIPLHSFYQQQAQESKDFFQNEKNQHSFHNNNARSLSNAEKKADTNLSYLLKLAKTETQRTKIKNARKVLNDGALKALPQQINRFFEKNLKDLKNKPESFIESFFMEVLDSFNVEIQEKNELPPLLVGVLNPKIVLSQSFQ